jgi:hypothetical protein
LNATTENGSTVVFGKVVGVKPQEVRATISFAADDVSLKDAFETARDVERVHTDHVDVPTQGSRITFALVIQDILRVDRGRNGEYKRGWEIGLRNTYLEKEKPTDGEFSTCMPLRNYVERENLNQAMSSWFAVSTPIRTAFCVGMLIRALQL